MATSGSTDYNATAIELINSAYELARVKDPIESLTSDQTTRAIASLNKIIKYMQKNGMPLWAVKKDSITLVQSTQSYTCGTGGTGLSERPLRILQAFYRDGSNDVEMEIISRQEYWELGDKSSEGVPNEIYYDPQLDLGVLYVYNPADANAAGNTINLIYHRPFEDIDSETNNFDFPQEWTIAIEYMLAVDIAFRNGVRQTRIAQLESKAKEYFYELTWWDVEATSLQIQPDMEGRAY
jgi:hypothetical protein